MTRPTALIAKEQSTGQQTPLMADEPGAVFGNATVDDHAIIWTAYGTHGREVFSARSLAPRSDRPSSARAASCEGSGMVTVFGPGSL
jgi:hypothetical protein